MFAIPGGLLLLHVPVLWLRGLPGPPPDDSLIVPRDGGLLVPVMPPPTWPNFGGPEKGSIWVADFDSLRPSAIKLPTTTCNGKKKPHCLLLNR